MKNFLNIDSHTHTSAISVCSRVTHEELIDDKIGLGFDGLILTNHCQPWYYPEEEHKNYVERVIEEFERARAYGEKKNFRVFLGLEVTIRNPHYSDWLLFGVSQRFLRETPCLYKRTQKELFELCDEWGVLLIQAHPFREGHTICDPRYMHGVEINAAPCDLPNKELVEEFAKRHDLLVSCGTDYHGKGRTYFGGIRIPASCLTAEDIAAHIRKEKAIETFQEGEYKRYKSSKIAEK